MSKAKRTNRDFKREEIGRINEKTSIQFSNKRRAIGIHVLLICLLSLFFFLWIGRNGIFYSKHSDFIARHAGIKMLGQKAFQEEGILPLWNPFVNCGSPVLANPESMYLYPLDWIYFFAPLDFSFNLVMTLNLLLSGLLMYWLAGRLFNDSLSRLYSALIYMTGWHFLAILYAGWIAHVSMYVLIPILFLATRDAARKKGIKPVLILSAGVLLGLLQGGMQLFYYSALGCLIYAAFLIIAHETASSWKFMLRIAAGAMLGILISSPVLLQRLEFAKLSTRENPDYPFFIDTPPAAKDLVTLFDPMDSNGRRDEFWESNFYFGIWLLPVAIYAIAKRRRKSTPLVAALGACILFSFDTPFTRLLFYILPGFSMFRQPERLLIFAQFIITLLAGAGFYEFRINPVYRKSPGFYRFLLLAMIVAPLLDSGIRMAPLFDSKPLSEAFPHHEMHDLLCKTASEGRTLAIGRTSIPYGMAGYYGIEMVNGYASLNLRHFREYFDVMEFGDIRMIPDADRLWMSRSNWTDCESIARPWMLKALNVEYITANQSLRPPPGYKVFKSYSSVPVFVFYQGNQNVPVFIWKSESPATPGVFAQSLKSVATDEESLASLLDATRPEEVFALNLAGDQKECSFKGGTIELIENGCNRINYRIRSDGENYVVFSQIWYPGWRLRIDGKDAPLFRSNHAFLGCYMTDGMHEAELHIN